MTDPRPFPHAQLHDLAGRAIGRVDAYGTRGATSLSTNQIEALVCVAVLAGVAPIPIGTPETLIIEGDPL